MFAALLSAFGDHYLYAGLGTTIPFTQKPVLAHLEKLPSGGMDEAEAQVYRALLATGADHPHTELAHSGH
jgi:hypothetical protein